MILNARKVQISADDDTFKDGQSWEAGKKQGVIESSNMLFELRNIDSNGRSILHKAALQHNSGELLEILNSIFYKLQSDALPPVTSKDLFGNTALILACIKRGASDNILDRRHQYQVVKHLLMYRQLETKSSISQNLEVSRQQSTYGLERTELKYFEDLYDKKLVQFSDDEYGEEAPPSHADGKIHSNSVSRYKNTPSNSIDVNSMNIHTRFSALHWACVHGTEKIVNMILENGSYYFLPDDEGYFPIDYAGMFNHELVVKLIIQRHLRNVRGIIETLVNNDSTKSLVLKQKMKAIIKEKTSSSQQNLGPDALRLQEIQIRKEQIKIDIRNHYLSRRQGTQLTTNWASLFFSPIFNTRLLYWASQCNLIELSAINDILFCLEAYPEGPVTIENSRTPIHAAAKVGNIEKLRALLNDVKNRYQGYLAGQEVSQPQWYWDLSDQEIMATKYKKRNLYPISDLEMMADQVRVYDSDKMVKEFYYQLSEYRALAAEDEKYWHLMQVDNKLPPGVGILFNYDFGGSRGNTPLHIASQYGRVECIQELIKKDYQLKADIRNLDGLMPLDLINFPEVKQTYIKHYKQQRRLALEQDPDQKAKQGSSINSIAPSSQVSQSPVPVSGPVNYREQLVMSLLREKEQLPQVPHLVLKISIGTKEGHNDVVHRSDIVNSMIQTMIKSKFAVTMFESLDQGIFFVGLQLNNSDLEKEALLMQFPIKLMDVDAKKAYNPAQRNLYEPFRSKDIQLIIMNRLQRHLTLSQYQEQGILLSVMPMHDYSGIADINAQWYKKGPYVKQDKRNCLRVLKILFGLDILKTMPLPLILQLFKEGSQYEYNELTSIKNYFGEKMAFHFVWMSFYTAWLIIPAFGGLAMTIYHIISGVDSTLNTLYAFLVCIWVTVFIERWKRKSSEICLKWGLSDYINNNTRIERNEHLGFEYFSHDSHRVEKKTVHTTKMLLGLTFQVPVFLLLIGCCVATFFGFQWIQQFEVEDKIQNSLIQIASGIVNTITIMIFDFLYSYMATYSVNMENHKYQDTYEQSYVYKIFTFKFVNTNIQIFYQAFYYQDFNTFYYMLLGMSITKSATIFFLKHIKKLLRFEFAKMRYFSRLESQARNQRDQQMRYSQENPAQKAAGKTLSGVANGEISGKLDETKYPVMQRHVMYAGKHEEKQRVFTDFIELNDLMIDAKELDIINERSEVFILFSMATLYCCACPIAPVVAIIHNIIDINMDLYANIKVMRRPWANTATNIGPWLTIAEFMAIAAVISNCLLLFFSTDQLRDFFYKQYGADYYQQVNIIRYCDMLLKQQGFTDLSADNYYEVHLLWLLVGVEHAIILIKQFMAGLIPDTPQWVSRALLRVELTKSELGQEELHLERNEQLRVVEEVKKALKAQLEQKNLMMQEVQRAFNVMEERIAANMERIRMLELEKQNMREQLYSTHQTGQQQAEEIKNKYREEMEKAEKQNRERQRAMILDAQKPKDPQTVGSLSEYLGVSQNEWMAKERKDYLEKELNRNIQKRLMHQTFVLIEREIMSNRLSKILDTKSSASNAISLLTGGLNIMCAQCQKSLAILECLDCMDHFCKPCSDSLHSNQEICVDHKILQLNVSLSGQEQPKPHKWKKFEYFNFPVLADNAPFNQFQNLFYYLTHRYMDQNYIDAQSQKVNLQSLFVNKNYEILTDIQAKLMKSRDSRVFGQVTEKMLESITCFNDEEMFYINKIAFYLFSEKGTELTFQHFTRTLGAFQSGTLQQRCNLWLHILAKEAKNSDLNAAEILDPYAIEQIPRKFLEEVIKFSFLQRRPETAPSSLQTASQVIDTIFKQALQIAKERSSSADQTQVARQLESSISNQQIWSVIERNEEVREFISCLLQFKPAPTTIQVANQKSV